MDAVLLLCLFFGEKTSRLVPGSETSFLFVSRLVSVRVGRVGRNPAATSGRSHAVVWL
jgi:hypothetical protein